MSLLSVLDVLNAMCNVKSLLLFHAIALEAEKSENLKTRLKLTRRQFYSRMSDLINAGLIIRRNRKYFLTSFGKVVYETHLIIGKAKENYWKLKAIDLFESSSELQPDERNKIIETLIDSNEIKDTLVGSKNIVSPAQSETVYNNDDDEELIVSAPHNRSGYLISSKPRQ